MGGCQNYGPFLCSLNTRCRTAIRTHKGTIILTTTHVSSVDHSSCAHAECACMEVVLTGFFNVQRLSGSGPVLGGPGCL